MADVVTFEKVMIRLNPLDFLRMEQPAKSQVSVS